MNNKKHTQALAKPYYTLSEAASYLSSSTNEDYSETDLVISAIRGHIKLCFYYDGQLGVFEDTYDDGDYEYIGPEFEFNGYLGIKKDDIYVENRTKATSVSLIEAIASDDPPNKLLKNNHHYCICSPPDGQGNQYAHPEHVEQSKILIPKAQLSLLSQYLAPLIIAPPSTSTSTSKE